MDPRQEPSLGSHIASLREKTHLIKSTGSAEPWNPGPGFCPWCNEVKIKLLHLTHCLLGQMHYRAPRCLLSPPLEKPASPGNPAPGMIFSWSDNIPEREAAQFSWCPVVVTRYAWALDIYGTANCPEPTLKLCWEFEGGIHLPCPRCYRTINPPPHDAPIML